MSSRRNTGTPTYDGGGHVSDVLQLRKLPDDGKFSTRVLSEKGNYMNTGIYLTQEMKTNCVLLLAQTGQPLICLEGFRGKPPRKCTFSP